MRNDPLAIERDQSIGVSFRSPNTSITRSFDLKAMFLLTCNCLFSSARCGKVRSIRLNFYWISNGVRILTTLLLFIENTIDKRKLVSAEIYSWALVTKAKERNALPCLIKSINRQTWRNSFACMLTFDIDGVAAAAVDSLFNWHDFKAWSSFSFVLVWAVLGENGCHQHGVNVCLRLGANELTAIMKNYTIRFFVNSIIKVVWTNSNILDILLTMKVSDRVRVE